MLAIGRALGRPDRKRIQFHRVGLIGRRYLRTAAVTASGDACRRHGLRGVLINP